MTTGGWNARGVIDLRLDAALDEIDEVASLHDRRLPQSKERIDHLAVTPTGVWVIAARRYPGMIRRVDDRLKIGRRDRTRLVDAVQRQVAYVISAVSLLDRARPPVNGALCILDGEFDLPSQPFELDGVLVTSPRTLRTELRRPGPLDGNERDLLQRALAAAFPGAH